MKILILQTVNGWYWAPTVPEDELVLCTDKERVYSIKQGLSRFKHDLQTIFIRFSDTQLQNTFTGQTFSTAIKNCSMVQYLLNSPNRSFLRWYYHNHLYPLQSVNPITQGNHSLGIAIRSNINRICDAASLNLSIKLDTERNKLNTHREIKYAGLLTKLLTNQSHVLKIKKKCI